MSTPEGGGRRARDQPNSLGNQLPGWRDLAGLLFGTGT